MLLQAKPFAMGVRVEHPQASIHEIQYHGAGREYLPAASYTLTAQVGGRGVYSFCMCPGGVIVPAMTDPSESVVNGMSSSGRNSRWANSGIVTEVRLSDFEHLRGEWGELAGLKFRRDFEQAARRAGGSAQVAPAQRLTDFVADRRSADLPATSYVPGTVPSRFSEWMPEFIGGALREGFAVFGRRMHGFLTDGAQVVGVGVAHLLAGADSARPRHVDACVRARTQSRPQRGPGMRAASSRRLSTGSVSRRPSCAISAERAAFWTGNFKRMVHMEFIEKYFGGKLTPLQRERFVRLYDLYAEWNARINVVSRKDFDSLYLKHVLHSLAIACACRFDGGAQVCDVGTGGGFPAVPLAIFFPGAHFTAADSIGKKITVVRAVASALGLDNLEAVNCRAEALPGGYDYVVSRAVTEMSVLKGWMWNKITPGRKGTLPNGMLVLRRAAILPRS